MAFSDFKNVGQVLRLHPLIFQRVSFLNGARREVPEWLLKNISFALAQQGGEEESEMFFREALIYPLLQEAWERHPRLKLWVNRALRWDDQLFGEPDYFVSAGIHGEVIDRFVRKPLLSVAEAKRQDFELGWGQCLAEMIACQKLNDDDRLTIHGVVTTGSVWEFGKLSGQTFTHDPLPRSLADVPGVLGALDYVFAESERQLDL